MLRALLRFSLDRPLVIVLLLAGLLGWGLSAAPFEAAPEGWPRDPVAVDALPDLGENQQIVFTDWPGRSPQDIEDQVSYPLTTALLGIPGVRTIRSQSMFGVSSLFVIFEEDVELYWSRSRLLEKLASLPTGTLPDGVQPRLGPDATALGQVFWYALEGRDESGQPCEGWSLEELRSLQDWTVRPALLAASGVAEVASIGGYVREYQIDIDQDALAAHGVSFLQVADAVRRSNMDVGARTIEMNRVEYLVRGVGFVSSVADLEQVVVAVAADEGVPIRVKDVARVGLGPAPRRGILDIDGAEAVGGVVVARAGANPLATIEAVKAVIAELERGLPVKTLEDGRRARVAIAPFYDRTELIHETIGTLETALIDEVLITILVVIVMLRHLRASALVAGMLPAAVLLCFAAMKVAGVTANIVALSGIAIAIGTMVDMGVILCESIFERLRSEPEGDVQQLVLEASEEVGSAVLTAVATTVVSFLPVFTMTGAEGKLFQPLALTKTFALLASVLLALTALPPLAAWLLRDERRAWSTARPWLGLAGGLLIPWLPLFGLAAALAGAYDLARERLPAWLRTLLVGLAQVLVVAIVGWVLSQHWSPLGVEAGAMTNLLFVALIVGGLLGGCLAFERVYPALLRAALARKGAFLLLPGGLVIIGLGVWLGAGATLAPLLGAAEALGLPAARWRESPAMRRLEAAMPGLGREFLPDFDEGSFLYMPTTMPHAGVEESLEVLQRLDRAQAAIPEIERVAGKIGRVDSPLDPAPLSMLETIVQYKSEYRLDAQGRRRRFAVDEQGVFLRDEAGGLIPDPAGRPYRQWRDEIRSTDDIWAALVEAGRLPGTTSAPKLQPIKARLVMLQSGMRAPLGIKVYGPSLEVIERYGLALEALLKGVEGVEPSAVFADRVVGKPYLEVRIDREAIARYGVRIADVQALLEVAVGGQPLTRTVEGRERYPVRARALREDRGSVEALARLRVPAAGGRLIPLEQLARIAFVRGPQAVKAEDSFLVSYVLFDARAGFSEVELVERCQRAIAEAERSGRLARPDGVRIAFAGSYEAQVRAEARLRVVLPIALGIILLLLYLQFRRLSTALLIFTGVGVAWAGGFALLGLYGWSGFLDVELLGANLREVFQVGEVQLSVAIWVGFLALFGIATDDGVVMATYLEQRFAAAAPETVAELREAIVEAGQRRIRPCLMTTATTLLALLPVLSSTGKGSNIMVPMAIPTFGGMAVELLTLFVVPVLFGLVQELRLRWRLGGA